MNVHDALVGRLAVQQGLISEATLEQCLNQGTQGPLGRVLVQRGLLRADVLASITLAARRAEVLCASCGFTGLPAALPPGPRLDCPRCRNPLIVASDHDTKGDTRADSRGDDSRTGSNRFVGPPPSTGQFATPGSGHFRQGTPGTGRFPPATPGSGHFPRADPFDVAGSTRRPAGVPPSGSGYFPAQGPPTGSNRHAQPDGGDDLSATVKLRRALAKQGGVVGQFEVLEELGRGGMGVVYKVRHLQRGELLALKVLTAGALASKRQRTRFGREADVMSRLQHPNIVQVKDHGTLGHALYMTMTLIEGKSLGDLVRTRRLSIRRAAEIARDVARGLQYAHEQGIIHRDVKPDNILIDRGGTPLLTDFGLMRDLDDEENRLTRSGAVVGTPYYMAPEQARGKRDLVGGRTDVYALGVVLYAMLTGDVPFKAETQIELLNRIVSSPPVPPSKSNPEVGSRLETITLRCLEKSPDRRYPTAGDLADDLDRYLRGEATTPPPRSHVPIVVAACAVLLAVVGGVALRGDASPPSTTGGVDVSGGNDTTPPPPETDAELAKTRTTIAALMEQADIERPGVPYRNALNDALVALDAARGTWAKDPEFALWRARAREQLHRFSEALEDYAEAWSLSLPTPGSVGAEALTRSALLQRRRGVDEAALALRLAPAVERLGTDSGPWGELAHAAQKLVGNEDPDTLELALEHADEARRADPRLSAAWALKGNLHALLDSRNEALTALDRALSLQPNKANWLAARGILHARASRLDRALEDAERALRLDGLHSDALKLRARLRMLDGDTNGAIQDLQRVTEDSPKDEHALLDLAQVYSLTDRFEEASASLTRAETLAPTLIDVWQTRVRLELERLSLDAALESLRRGIDKVASDEDRQRLHTRYVAMAYFGKRQRSLRLYSTERLAKDPNDRWGLCAEAEFTALNKDYKRAADLFGRCADKHPNYPEARIQQFRILYLLKDKGESDPDLEPRLRRFLDEHSEDPVVLCYAVHYYASIGNDVSRAQAKARRATEVAPTFGLAWRTRALISGILKERRDGLEFARRACALDPDDYEAFRIAGSLLAEADDMPGALKAWLSSLAAFPLQDNVAEHVMLALVKSKKSSVAIEFAKKRYALARVTTKPPTLGFEIHFLNALVNLKRWGEAATTLTKIQTRELTHPADACGLALALAKMGRRKEAKALLEGVLQKAPGHPQAERLLAQIESGRGL